MDNGSAFVNYIRYYKEVDDDSHIPELSLFSIPKSHAFALKFS